MMPNSLGG
jgi:hypothetical protein